MIIAGVILLTIAFFSMLSAIIIGGFLGESLTGFFVFLGVGLALLISGIIKRKSKK